MRRFIVRAAVLAIFTAGISTATGLATASTAIACEEHGKSFEFAATLPQVNYGDSGQHVLGLQLALRGEGYNLQGTGNYADSTLAAVRDFQRVNGINDSGIVGSKTWAALVGRKPSFQTGNGVIQPPEFGINPGETNADKMYQLRDALYRVHPYADNDEWLGEGDTYGPLTQQVVRDFQRRTGINQSGIVGPKTWNALYEVIAVSGRWGC